MRLLVPRGFDGDHMVKVKRVYDEVEKNDGKRFLVDRMWPRGIKKEALRLDGWIKDVAPSSGLRQWFGHDAGRWEEFSDRYVAELEKNRDAWEGLLQAAREGTITLLYSAHDEKNNNAVVLKAFLDRRLKKRGDDLGH